MKMLVTSLMLCAAGCSYTHISDGQFTAKRWTFGNKTSIGHLQAVHGTNSIILDQYANDQNESLRAISEGIAAGVIRGAKSAP